MFAANHLTPLVALVCAALVVFGVLVYVAMTVASGYVVDADLDDDGLPVTVEDNQETRARLRAAQKASRRAA